MCLSPYSRRAAFSLLEVLLATATFVGSVIVLVQLANIGRRHTNSAEDLASAQRLCQNKLNEMLSCVAAMTPVQNETLEEESGWVYSVDIDPLGRSGLAALRVTVAQDLGDAGTGVQFSLVRWIRDPDASSDSAAIGPDAGGPWNRAGGDEP